MAETQSPNDHQVRQAPTKTTRNKPRDAVKRQAIVGAAKAAFSDIGVKETSMDKLAEMAGVSKRTVYNHFANKEALVMHLLGDLWAETMVDIRLPESVGEEPKAQLSYILKAEVDSLCSKQSIDLYRVAFGHFFYQPQALQNEMSKLDLSATALYRWLEGVREKGVLPIVDTQLAFDQLHSLIKGRCFWPQILCVEEPLNEEMKNALVESTVSLFFHGCSSGA